METELPGQLFGVRVFASTLKGRNLTHPAIVFMKEIPRGLLTVNPVSDAPLQGNIIKQCNVITGMYLVNKHLYRIVLLFGTHLISDCTVFFSQLICCKRTYCSLKSSLGFISVLQVI